MPNPFMAQGLSLALEARLLVAVTFHYVPTRLVYLADVVRSLCAFPVCALQVVVFTNTHDAGDLQSLNAVLAGFAREGVEILPISCRELAHPYFLTWAHKAYLRAALVEGGDFTHCIYAEDDMRVTFENFLYFVACREALDSHGLVPSFLRVEYDRKRHVWTNLDNMGPMTVDGLPGVAASGLRFVNAANPYCAVYMLDRRLAAEYAASPSFDLRQSASRCPWDVRERAAMGLAFENVPPGFSSRCVVPAARGEAPPPYCWLHHLSNNYVYDRASPFGKVPMRELFV